MFSKKPLKEERFRESRRSGTNNQDFYINFFTVGPITEDTQRVTGMII